MIETPKVNRLEAEVQNLEVEVKLMQDHLEKSVQQCNQLTNLFETYKKEIDEKIKKYERLINESRKSTTETLGTVLS